MRVLIAGLWAATEPSGICRTIANLVRGLEEENRAEVIVAIGAWQRGYFERALGLRSTKARLVYVDVANSTVTRNSWYLLGLPRLAEAVAADVVHLSFPAPILRAFYKAAIVATVHDLYPYDCPETFGYPRVFGNRIALRLALSAADRLACVSASTLGSLQRAFPRAGFKKAVKIENANTPLASGAVFSQPTAQKPFLLAVAQHRAHKNLDLLLRSFHELHASVDHRDLQLVIVGSSGPETTKLHALTTQLGVSDRVLYRSNLADAELAQLYQSCEAFITLSKIEGYGLPLGEALGAGARALASDIPAHRAVGSDRCAYVQICGQDSSRRVASAIADTLRHSKPTTPFAKGSAGEVAKRYLVLYEQALLQRRSREYPRTSSALEFD